MLLVMCAHVFSYCSCGDIALYIAGNTSSRSCSAHFLCKNDLLSQKGGEKKKFCDKIVFVHLCICIYMYTNIRIRIITLFFSHSHVNIVLFKAEDTFSRSYCVPFFFCKKPFLSQRQRKNVLWFWNKKNSAHSSMHAYRHTYVHCYLFPFDCPCVNIVLFMAKRVFFFFFFSFLHNYD